MQILMQTEGLGNFWSLQTRERGGFLSSYSETGPFPKLHWFFLGLYHLNLSLFFDKFLIKQDLSPYYNIMNR